MTSGLPSEERAGNPERVLVTGAASGLGRAIATRYVREGRRVLITDVNDEALAEVERELKGLGEVTSRRLDVTDDADWMRARQWVEDTWQGLDVLVNNAGVAAGGRMELIPMADWDWIIELNLKSVIRGCRTFIPLLKKQASGHIVNVASLAGIANSPSMANYNVTKAAVISLSQTLRYELAPYGIGTSVVTPAFVKTNLAASMRSADPEAVRLAERMINNATVTAEQIADQVFDGVQKNRFLINTHREGKAISLIQRISPALLERLVAKRWAKVRLRMEKAKPTVGAGA
jgi:NADP-dependent 3-hydroxy acid dehydrogenase YdfG